MNQLLPSILLSLREGLEAFLIIIIILKFLDKIKRVDLKRNVAKGAGLGLFLSSVIGGILFLLSNSINQLDTTAQLWESGASFVALILVTTFIIWMIKHGANLSTEIEAKTEQNLSKVGIIALVTLMVAREGAEIAIFSFAGEYNISGILIGLVLALIIAILFHYSLIKFNLKTIFNITLAYLILQAGYLLGTSIHEALEVLETLGYLAQNSFILTKAFDLSSTIFNYKEGILGIPLNVLFGWNSKPEWIRFITQYSYTILIFSLWLKNKKLKD